MPACMYVRESKSSIVNSVSPRAVISSRTATTSSRNFSWKCRFLASSHRYQCSMLAVVSCPARVKVDICASISCSESLDFGSSEKLALTIISFSKVSFSKHHHCRYSPRTLIASFFDESPLSTSWVFSSINRFDTLFMTLIVWR